MARLGAEADVHGWSYHLGRITKRGNRYLRTLFMQGARVILLRPVNWAKHSFGVWLTAAARRLHHNVLAAALANKLARIAWTVLAQGRSYEARIDVIQPAIRGSASKITPKSCARPAVVLRGTTAQFFRCTLSR